MQLKIPSKCVAVVLLVMTIVIVICIERIILHAYEVIVTHNANNYLDTLAISNDTDYLKSLLFSGKKLPQKVETHIIRSVYLTEVPSSHLGYNFEKQPPKLAGQIGTPIIVDAILGKKQNGFYIEAGAHDGESLSNTLLFELKRNYTGLLVEPSSMYKTLLSRNRNAQTVNVCLATQSIPHKVEFMDCAELGGIRGEVKGWAADDVKARANKTIVPCLPLYSILMALGNPPVDYFSLDIEGAELAVLRTIPWGKVAIHILSIEVGDNGRDPDGVDNLMKSVGYTKVVDLLGGLDNIYVRNDFRSPVFGKEDATPILMKMGGYGHFYLNKTLRNGILTTKFVSR